MDAIPTVQTLTRLNIGCGTATPKDKNWINCDMYPGPNVDVVFDATKPWPFKESSVGEVLAVHVLEHLHEPELFFKEAWHALCHGARIVLRLPYGPSSSGFSDITHVKTWTPGMFCFLQPGYGKAVHNPQHDEREEMFIVESTQLRVNPNLRWFCKFPFRQLGAMNVLNYMWDAYIEILVSIRVIKEQGVIDKFLELSSGNRIPLSRCMYEYELQGRKAPKNNQPRRIVNFDLYSTGFESIEAEEQL